MSDSIETKLHDLLRVLHSFGHRLGRVLLMSKSVRYKRIMTESKDGTQFQDALEELYEDLRHVMGACSEVLRMSLPRVESEKRQPSELRNNTPIKVLWIEDDDLQMSVLRGQFEDAKWDLTHASSIDEGFELLETSAFDGVMVDMIMPPGRYSYEETAGGQRTGLVMAREIRKQHPSMPIVFLTIANTPELIEWCRRNRPALVLSKPDIDADKVRHADRLIRYHTDARLDDIEDLLKRFPRFVNALAHRHSNRPAFQLVDEYDVQDLLRGLLLFTLSDVREEEFTPSYVGASSRIDFVLPLRQTAIEVKMTRRGMTLRELSDQLIVDIGRYRAHPDVQSLICFVVDAAGIVLNRDGLIRDLQASSSDRLEVRAVICDFQAPIPPSPVPAAPKRREKKAR